MNDIYQQVMDLYKQGLSAREIKENLQLKQSVRQIQRWIKDYGISRSHTEAFKLAVSQGKVKYDKRKKRASIPLKLRYRIFVKDNFRCKLCGNDASNIRLEVDHIDNDPINNTIDNLQVLCSACNLGKARYYL